VTTHQLTLLTVTGIAVCWGALALAWLFGAIYYESQAPAERIRSSWFSAGISLALLLTIGLDRGVPRSIWNTVALPAWVRILGLVILVSGTAFAIWARLVLGAMWSAVPAVKEEHKLRTSGPYRVTRHPIYTGLLAMLAGTGLLIGDGRGIVVAFPIYVAFIQIKLHIEERLMLAEFPDDYPRYRQQVPQLVPGLRLGREKHSS
jgi:protein-S-isoprenylcysteine O-methyltransferase Ste14